MKVFYFSYKNTSVVAAAFSEKTRRMPKAWNVGESLGDVSQ